MGSMYRDEEPVSRTSSDVVWYGPEDQTESTLPYNDKQGLIALDRAKAFIYDEHNVSAMLESSVNAWPGGLGQTLIYRSEYAEPIQAMLKAAALQGYLAAYEELEGGEQ